MLKSFQTLYLAIRMKKACPEGEKTFECENCEITFSEKESLQKHQDEVCQKYKCDKCESTFPIFELLEQHDVVHSNEPNNLRREMQKIRENAIILCGICDKRFTNEVKTDRKKMALTYLPIAHVL